MASAVHADLAPKEDFAAMLNESLGSSSGLEGTVMKGMVVGIENDNVLIDVGLKSEGRVPLKEFTAAGAVAEINIGDIVEVYLERMEDKNGEAQLSREKARREEAWTLLERNFQANERVTGVIFGRVKGGFTVDLSGAVAFLPGSQVDIRPVRDITPLIGTPQPFQILKMDRSRGNIVVSRRAVLEESRAEQRSELVANLKEGQILNGVVKNITDYGAFVDLGGVDGLLHVTDIAWRRINHPSEALHIGQSVKVQVIRFNPETQRISLGMKQLEADPWEGVELKYPSGSPLQGPRHEHHRLWRLCGAGTGRRGTCARLRNVVDQEERPSRQDRVDLAGGRSHGAGRRSAEAPDLARSQADAGQSVGSVRGTIPGRQPSSKARSSNITEFGLFVGLPGEIDGMVHLSDIDWARAGEEAVNDYKKGDEVRVKVLDVDVEKERISLGIKQLGSDPYEEGLAKLKKGDVVTTTVTAVTDGGLEVTADGMPGFIRKADLSRDRSEQRPDRFAVGEKVDAKVTALDKATRKITLSIKAREMDEEKQALADFGSSDSGASLGDILGAAMRARTDKNEG